MKDRKRLFIKTFPRVFPLLLVLWVLLVLYPNPLNLLTSIWRAVDPATDPQAVTALAAGMPGDPVDIEPAVLQAIPYRYDWEIHGMPWYFPTVEEVIEKGQGDCKARALVMASVLESKGIPYTIRFSPIHIWVEYEGKESTSTENSGVSFFQLDPETGGKSLRLPSISLREVAQASWEGFWPPMPFARKTLLVGGVSLLALLLVVSLRVRRTSRIGQAGIGTRLGHDKSVSAVATSLPATEDSRSEALSTERPSRSCAPASNRSAVDM